MRIQHSNRIYSLTANGKTIPEHFSHRCSSRSAFGDIRGKRSASTAGEEQHVAILLEIDVHSKGNLS